MPDPSKAYRRALEQSKKVHEGKTFTGLFLRPHAPFVKEIIDRLGCRSALDYGCGKGQQYERVMPKHGMTIEEWWGIKVAKYDPAYPPFAKEPEGKFDLVICTHTLATIPADDLSWVIDRLHSFAAKAIYVSERLGEARKELGDNSLRPFSWTAADWMKALQRDSDVEVTLATRTVEDDRAKITTHHRWENGEWSRVAWPQGLRALNHTWA